MDQHYAEVRDPQGNRRMITRSAHGGIRAIENAHRWLKHHSRRTGVGFNPGTPMWLSGPLTWDYTRGYGVGTGIWLIVSNSGMRDETLPVNIDHDTV